MRRYGTRFAGQKVPGTVAMETENKMQLKVEVEEEEEGEEETGEEEKEGEDDDDFLRHLDPGGDEAFESGKIMRMLMTKPSRKATKKGKKRRRLTTLDSSDEEEEDEESSFEEDQEEDDEDDSGREYTTKKDFMMRKAKASGGKSGRGGGKEKDGSAAGGGGAAAATASARKPTSTRRCISTRTKIAKIAKSVKARPLASPFSTPSSTLASSLATTTAITDLPFRWAPNIPQVPETIEPPLPRCLPYHNCHPRRQFIPVSEFGASATFTSTASADIKDRSKRVKKEEEDSKIQLAGTDEEVAAIVEATLGLGSLGKELKKEEKKEEKKRKKEAAATAVDSEKEATKVQEEKGVDEEEWEAGEGEEEFDPSKRNTWTPDEDKILLSLVERYGPKKWGTIANFLPLRNAKQCHQRWHYVLKTSISRTPWTEREDYIIFYYQRLLGNKWSHIAKYLPGRTGYAVRNRHMYLVREVERGNVPKPPAENYAYGLELKKEDSARKTSSSSSSDSSTGRGRPGCKIPTKKTKKDDTKSKSKRRIAKKKQDDDEEEEEEEEEAINISLIIPDVHESAMRRDPRDALAHVVPASVAPLTFTITNPATTWSTSPIQNPHELLISVPQIDFIGSSSAIPPSPRTSFLEFHSSLSSPHFQSLQMHRFPFEGSNSPFWTEGNPLTPSASQQQQRQQQEDQERPTSTRIQSDLQSPMSPRGDVYPFYHRQCGRELLPQGTPTGKKPQAAVHNWEGVFDHPHPHPPAHLQQEVHLVIGNGEAKAREEAAEALTSSMRLLHGKVNTPKGGEEHNEAKAAAVAAALSATRKGGEEGKAPLEDESSRHHHYDRHYGSHRLPDEGEHQMEHYHHDEEEEELLFDAIRASERTECETTEAAARRYIRGGKKPIPREGEEEEEEEEEEEGEDDEEEEKEEEVFGHMGSRYWEER